MTLREAIKAGNANVVAEKLFPWITGVCLLLAMGWLTYAFIDICGALWFLLKAVGVIVVLIVTLLAAAFIVDAVSSMLT